MWRRKWRLKCGRRSGCALRRRRSVERNSRTASRVTKRSESGSARCFPRQAKAQVAVGADGLRALVQRFALLAGVGSKYTRRHSDNPESSHPTSTYTAAEELRPTFVLAFAKDTTGFVTTLQDTYTSVPRKATPRALALQVGPVRHSRKLIACASPLV